MNLRGTRVAVLGAGVSGRAAALLAAGRGAEVVVADAGPGERLADAAAELRSRGLRVLLGEEALRPDARMDLAVLSPGIPRDSALAGSWMASSRELLGEIEFAWRLWEGPVVAITGTNGKTTCTGLTARLLQGGGIACEPAGNYGKPFSQIVLEGSRHRAAVLELSSFQLETVSSFHPGISVWLNFAPDHMDRYASVADYRGAKQRIFLNQDERDHAVINSLEFPECPLRSETITFSAYGEADFSLAGDGDGILFRGATVAALSETCLLGRHNAENLMAALAVGWIHGLTFDGMRQSAGEFAAPAHRCELVGRLGGAIYVNDSKSTNAHALQSSLRAQSAPVVLIVGGKDKGLDYAPLLELLREKVRKVIAIGENRRQWSRLCDGRVACEETGSVEGAVGLAQAAARSGDVVLFSPGTSSFDMFRDFEQRGEVFRAAVEQRMHQTHVR
ncbi:MAG TPA: UDP-N-acetylmuramoyl-L-alanine--D-glutamate ligase [Verrucomicrobiales bacterium]|nr:UDP-N-acetylmuramoyl-L-alanine--D-glutamate ligase [Verrucomicrobiales bacterium]